MRNRILIYLLIALLTAIPVLASDSCRTHEMASESLRYNVMFKWGLINKKAGQAVLTLHRGPESYHTQLTAASEPWADRFYRVRDTLNGRMEYAGMRPLFYEKIAHEGKEVKHDQVHYDYSTPGNVIGRCTRREWKEGRQTVDETREMEAENSAVDMLTSFYYMRSMPFAEMQPGDSRSVAIFSGKRKETLTIRYVGLDNVKIGKNYHQTYHVKFTFTSKGGAKTSDDMDAWIGTGSQRIPLKMEGKLPVGKVQCFYAGE